MTTQPQEIALRLIQEEAPFDDGDHRRVDLAAQIDSAEQLSALAGELKGVIAQEAESIRKLETRRTRRAVLEQQLREAREEAARLMLEDAFAARDAKLVEADEAVAARQTEAAQIIDEARQRAEGILAEADRESSAIVDQGRERLRTLEEEAILRAAELDNNHRALTDRLQVMETLYDELQATLKLVAETSIEDLGATQKSLRRLDETHPLPEAPAATDLEIGRPVGADGSDGSVVSDRPGG